MCLLGELLAWDSVTGARHGFLNELIYIYNQWTSLGLTVVPRPSPTGGYSPQVPQGAALGSPWHPQMTSVASNLGWQMAFR